MASAATLPNSPPLPQNVNVKDNGCTSPPNLTCHQSKLALIGFWPNLEDQSTYIYKSGEDMEFLWVHMDDGLFTASSQALLDKLKSKLDEVHDLKWDLMLSSIVGIHIKEIKGGSTLDQLMLIEKILNFDPSNIKARSPTTSIIGPCLSSLQRDGL
ncbi:hypothetical protein MJO29_004260 [Puccinia striiformis f. sp. tritici]|nr:hypothetical protein MJO29_004260 [Puccinia striiformis f. sp. tritici]